MKLAPQYEFNSQQENALKKARITEYITIAYLGSVIYLMYLVMGSSQAMKTAWIEDCLSLVPPICFLIGSHISWRKPTKHYPYGFHRVISILFLCASLALLIMGGYLFIDAAIKLFKQEHPTIGMREYFGQDLWLGWWMIMTLLWGTFPPIILGHIKMKYAKTLNDKILITDGKMNKADWMTAVAAISGILGIGYGLWWADAVAAAIISANIIKDGWKQTKNAVTGLIDRAPTSLEDKYINLPDKIINILEKEKWIKKADVRLREQGHLFFGEGFILPAGQNGITQKKQEKLLKKIHNLDWRLQDFALTLDTRTKREQK